MKRWMAMSRSACALVILGLFAISSVACKPPQKQSGPREKITIAYSTAVNAILVYIAFANGYFAEEGLDVTPQPYPFGKLALDAVLEGKADLATAADTPIVFAILNGKKITTTAVIQTANRDNAIVARRDRGISKPADLKGRKIGVTLGTNADFFAGAFLLVNGIDKGQAKIIDMKPDEMAAALDSGKVDAISTFNPTINLLKKGLGNKGVVFFGEDIYTEKFCLAAMQEYVKKNPEAIKKVLRALIKAEGFAQQNPEEARHKVADFIKINKALLDELWSVFTTRVVLDQALLIDLEAQTRWAFKNKLITRKDMPNYLDYIYDAGLQAVKPEAVRLIR